MEVRRPTPVHCERIEAELRQAQKTEALGRIACEVAHDFGNILNIISGSLEMLENRPDDVEFLTLTKGATHRGMKAVKSLLSFARRQPMLSEVFDLNGTLSSMDNLLRQAVGSRVKLNIRPAARAVLDQGRAESG